MATYGWIGLGNMGGPMTANILDGGHRVQGFDLDPQALREAAQRGVTTVGSVAEAVQGADVVFTMLPKGEHVRAVFDGESGIWAHAAKSTLLVDSSTVDVETSQFCHDESARRGFQFVDAPVSGGISGAAAATLAFMVGGDDDAVQKALDYIDPMAGKTIAAGAATTGISAKVCNNMMLFINLMAAAEGSQLADRLGLDPKVFWEIASVSSGRSWAQQTWYPMPGVIETAAANNNYEATFRADLALKDVTLALNAGELTGVTLEAAQLASTKFQHLVDEGLGDKDCSLISKYVSPDGTAPGYRGEAQQTRGTAADDVATGAAGSAAPGKAPHHDAQGKV